MHLMVFHLQTAMNLDPQVGKIKMVRVLPVFYQAPKFPPLAITAWNAQLDESSPNPHILLL
jgi:hypothetical protein